MAMGFSKSLIKPTAIELVIMKKYIRAVNKFEGRQQMRMLSHVVLLDYAKDLALSS